MFFLSEGMKIVSISLGHPGKKSASTMSNLPAKLTNMANIFRYRFLSCKIEMNLSYFSLLYHALFFSVYTAVMFILQFSPHFTDDVTGSFR